MVALVEIRDYPLVTIETSKTRQERLMSASARISLALPIKFTLEFGFVARIFVTDLQSKLHGN